jgi:hypothetical protein
MKGNKGSGEPTRIGTIQSTRSGKAAAKRKQSKEPVRIGTTQSVRGTSKKKPKGSK